VPRILLLLAILFVAWILIQRARSVPPHKRRAEFIKLGLGFAVFLVVILTLAGKMHWVGAALTGLLVLLRQMGPTLIRLFPMLASLRQSSTASAGQQSTVETDILRMHLDHDTGELQGEVLQGPFKDWLLSELDREQLRELYRYCESEDRDSVQLLESYLSQRFPDEDSFDSQPPPGRASDGPMNRKEALAVLGLTESAGREDIIDAHRKLMQKLHPDRGGNDYLAAKINQAKDFLLQSGNAA
jgi:hypothetical protein